MAAPAFQPKQRIIYFQGAKIMQTSAMKACFQKEESTPYDGADSLKQILILSTFQFTRFQPTELNSLLVSTR